MTAETSSPESAAASDELAGLSFPRLSARTRRFTLGEPRNIKVVYDGRWVLFLRTSSGTDATGSLWLFDVETRAERLLVDPRVLLGGADEELSEQERARRERSREVGAGVVDYSVAQRGRGAVFALSGRLWACELVSGDCWEVETAADVIDPHIDPTETAVAYVTASGELRLVDLDTGDDKALAVPDSDTVTWGQAEFVAAEEMDRDRGYWWSPDGQSLLVQRTDAAPVPVWQIADPADPSAPPTAHRYPVAGSDDAIVTLWQITRDGIATDLGVTSAEYPYLTRVSWNTYGAVVQVMSRDQRRALILEPNLTGADADDAESDNADNAVDADNAVETDGAAVGPKVVAEQADEPWLELVSGVPVRCYGQVCTTFDEPGARRLALDGVPVTPTNLHVRSVLGCDLSGVLMQASWVDDPTSIHVVRLSAGSGITPISTGPGVHHAVHADGTTVVSSSTLDSDGVTATVYAGGEQVGVLGRTAISPGFVPEVTLLAVGERQLRTAVLFPRDHEPASQRLPVLLAPYGGPHAQLVLQHRRGFLQAQYLADQGFCVIVADGRGTPGRSPQWEKEIRDEFASVTLQDQVDALAGVAAQYPDDVDTDRVGILGWSYGGYLAALAVLARPDVFHAAVAGAPVTDWELYDTFYTERYLGHPAKQPEVYRRNSLLDMASTPSTGEDPALLILHGMVDDNVVVAHSLRLSSALLAAGRPHAVLPLTGVTHMTPQEVVAENLLRLQVQFLRKALEHPAP